MFHRFASHAARWAGSVWLFGLSIVGTGLWLSIGVATGFHPQVHLWVTSILTVTTWLVCLLIQHEQCRQEDALQAKMDELIRAIASADNRLIGIEKPPDEKGKA